MAELRYRFWRRLHLFACRVRNRWGLEPGWKWGMYGCGLHVDKDRIVSKVCKWVGDRWIPEWIERSLARSEKRMAEEATREKVERLRKEADELEDAINLQVLSSHWKSYHRVLVQDGCAVREVWAPLQAKVGEDLTDAHGTFQIIEVEPRIRAVQKIVYYWTWGMTEATRSVILENTQIRMMLEVSYVKE